MVDFENVYDIPKSNDLYVYIFALWFGWFKDWGFVSIRKSVKAIFCSFNYFTLHKFIILGMV